MIFPVLYALLLCDVIKRSDDLINILKAVYQPRIQLLYTLLLMLITLYIFAMVGFMKFADHYEGPDETADFPTYCDSLWSCYSSTVVMGLRMGGGIGDTLRKTTIDDDLHASRIVFDIFFFVWISVILLNVVFGIIIDTFSSMRERAQEIEDNMNSICFI